MFMGVKRELCDGLWVGAERNKRSGGCQTKQTVCAEGAACTHLLPLVVCLRYTPFHEY